MNAGDWLLDQRNLITFVLVDAAGLEVDSLGNGFTLLLAKAGAAFTPGTGDKAEMGSGWYSYLASAGEADTIGPVSIVVTAPGCQQQNLEYTVLQRTITALAFTYTVTDSVTALPIEGVQVWISTQANGSHVVWAGLTDSFGVARDLHDQIPRLDPGTYYVWRQRSGYLFDDPDVEVVAP